MDSSAVFNLVSGVSGLLAVAAAPEVAPGPKLAALIPLLPLLGCILCGVFAALRVKSKLPAWTSVLLLGVSFAITVMIFLQLKGDGHGGEGEALRVPIATIYEWITFRWGNSPAQQLTANFAFYLDSLTLLWMLFVTGLGMLIALYASEYMSHDLGAGYCRFFAAFNLFVFSMACLVMADNFVLLYLGWEGVGLCSYLLIGYFYKKPSAVAAAKKAFIVNRIGDLGLALGIWLIYTKFGTVEYAALWANADFQMYTRALKDHNFAAIPWTVQLIPALLAIGAFGKSAQFPLYVWLPDAMEGPTPVSALIHAATMVTAGVFLVARCIPIFLLSEYALPIVAWIGTVTAVLAATIGMAQFDIKRIMAYSTVSQLGFMFAGLGFLTSVGAASHVFTHAFFKALLFLACGAVMHGFAGQLDLRRLSGVQKMPGWRIVGITMLIGCLNLAGFPLITSGFWSKDMIMAEGFVTPGPGYKVLGFLLVLTAGLTAYYTFRVYFRVFLGPQHYEPGEEYHGPDIHDESRAHIPKTVAEQEEFAHEAHKPTEAGGHHDEHGGFHPHPPGWAINTVLATLALLTFVAIPLVLMPKETHGWVGGMVHASSADVSHVQIHGEEAKHAGFLADPHQWMLAASSLVGIIGILIAWWLHLAGRTQAATSRADALLPKLGPIPRWAQHKWYVDEFYDYLIRIPLWVISHIFHWIDKLLVDGLVDLAGVLPRGLGSSLRPAHSGQLHGYALAMAGGVAFLILLVLIAAR